MAYKYKVLEGKGKTAKIQKSGLKHEFNVSDIYEDLERIKKFRREKTAQIDVELAKIENVLRNHPKVGELNDVELGGAFIVQQSKIMIKAIEDKFKELTDLEAEYLSDLAKIKKQTGIKF